jgi:hypothetical protein
VKTKEILLTCNAMSFGEVFHVAAAAILNEHVKWRVKHETDEHRRTTQFLEECSLGREHLQVSRQRRNSTKATTIVAEAFKKSAADSQKLLRDSWLPTSLDRSGIQAFCDKRLASIDGMKVLLWNRDRDYEPERNTSPMLLEQLSQLAHDCRMVPLIVGSCPTRIPPNSYDLTGHWRQPGIKTYREQLAFFDELREKYSALGSIGNRSGAMDGPALLGLRTLYLEDGKLKGKKQRMEQWICAIPNYKRQYLDDRDPKGLCIASEDNRKEIAGWLGRLRSGEIGGPSENGGKGCRVTPQNREVAQ